MHLKRWTLRLVASACVAASMVVISGGTPARAAAGYELQHFVTHKCLLADHAVVISGKCGVPNQRWNRPYVAADPYRPLENAATGRCLAGRVNLAVTIEMCDFADEHQLWKLVDTGGGYYRLENKFLGLYVSTDFSQQVYLWNVVDNQKWGLNYFVA
jgi:hypothetical protein